MAKNLKKNKDIKKNEGKSKVRSGLDKLKNLDILKKSYDLPEENLTLNVIMHKMSETLESYLKIIQQILQPEEFHSMHECNIFDDKDKSRLLDLYKQVIIAHRELLKAEIMIDDKNSISTINYVHSEIESVKPELVKIVGKLQESWKKEYRTSEAHYFG
jgi:hypothetical protein